MTRIAILGGGISGLTAAYELELARQRGAPIDWHLYEASGRLGGIIETTRHTTPDGTYILEGGPDAWVTEKPWARDLAIELGLERDLIYSNDATRRTYILLNGKLQPIPDRMRLMVPEDLSALEDSPLFTDSARAAYATELASADELRRAAQLREAAPEPDESVAAFVLRHFGDEVLHKLAAPLLSGVFGGNVHKLSARAVMPQFVAMEREHGSLIAALQTKSRARGNAPLQPIFTTLRNGMASLIDALVAALPSDRIHLNQPAYEIDLDVEEWYVDFIPPQDRTMWRRLTTVIPYWNQLILATPLDAARALLTNKAPGTELAAAGRTILPDSFFIGEQPALSSYMPTDASSAVLTTFCWPAEIARTFAIPEGFGFLVPQKPKDCHPDLELAEGEGPASRWQQHEPQLLACTVVDQKFPHRCPPGARILRAFFGGEPADALNPHPNHTIAQTALTQLRAILGPIPEPSFTTVRRLPRSLPQYEVGHLDRMAKLDALIARTPGLHLLGNAYRGVGLPDLIQAARTTARSLISHL